jgi:L-threonylcarbamoyladenylate synthase
MPDHLFVRELIVAIGAPLAATSANLSGLPPATTAEEALHALGGTVDLIIDGGPCKEGVASTVVDLTASPPRILRHGAISREELQRVVPDFA